MNQEERVLKERNTRVLISVVIPVYNAEDNLSECIESLLKQTEQRFEILLINDGSIDESGRICEEYTQKSKKIRVYQQENRGVSVARNKGIALAKGQYIVFVDADDWVEEKYLEILISNMQVGGMSACNLIINDNKKKEHGNLCYLTKEEAEQSVFLQKGIQGFPVTKMFDLNLIREHGIRYDEDIAICEDLLFVVKYLEVTTALVSYVDLALYHYRLSSTGAVNSRFCKTNKFNEKMLTEFEALRRCGTHLSSSEVIEKAYCFRMVKAAVATLRTLCANKITNTYKSMYSELLNYVRKYARAYILCSGNVISSKISVMLCALSPNVEYLTWKMIQK